ncbi:carboxypeptidase regulatory-like domain-containing protein [Clostridium sp.]
MRRRKRRILAAGMVVVITCSSYGSVPRVYANTNFYQIREIESLSEQVLYQKVPYGTRYQALEMPDSIDVFVSGGGQNEDVPDVGSDENVAAFANRTNDDAVLEKMDSEEKGEKEDTEGKGAGEDGKDKSEGGEDLEKAESGSGEQRDSGKDGNSAGNGDSQDENANPGNGESDGKGENPDSGENGSDEKGEDSDSGKNESDEKDDSDKTDSGSSGGNADLNEDGSSSNGKTDEPKEDVKTDEKTEEEIDEKEGFWRKVKVHWVLDAEESQASRYDGENPGIYLFRAELKSSNYEVDEDELPVIQITVLEEEQAKKTLEFAPLEESIADQILPLGSKESDIRFPETLTVRETTGEETTERTLPGITWKLDAENSDYSEFQGGLAPEDYFDRFDEDGEPEETEEKTWEGYDKANEEYNGAIYTYVPVIAESEEIPEDTDLPEIHVQVGDAGIALYADEGITGKGTEADPYVIRTPDQWSTVMGENKNNKYNGYQSFGVKTYIRLGDNIDLSGESWESRTLTACLDGDGYTLSGISQPLFSVLNGTVKNLILSDVRIVGTGNQGAIAQTVGNKATVEKCYVSGSITATGYNDSGAGGLIGAVQTTNGAPLMIENCVVNADITGKTTSLAGGLIGSVSKSDVVTIEKCIAMGTVSNENGKGAGGLVGGQNQKVTIKNSAALQEEVSTKKSTYYVDRIFGYFSDYNVHVAGGQNFAYQGMRVKYGEILLDKENDKNRLWPESHRGEHVSKTDLLTTDFWENKIGWGSDTENWKFDNNQLPTLKMTRRNDDGNEEVNIFSGADIPEYLEATETKTGSVKSGETGIEGAEITFKKGSSEKKATTDSDGNFSIALANGDYDVTIKQTGYFTVETTVTISDANSDVLDFTLDVNPVSMPSDQTVTGTFQTTDAETVTADGKIALTYTGNENLKAEDFKLSSEEDGTAYDRITILGVDNTENGWGITIQFAKSLDLGSANEKQLYVHYKGSLIGSITLKKQVNLVKLAMPVNVRWDETVKGKAVWSPVENASGYKVQLYKDGLALGDEVTLGANAASHDFTSQIAESGTYTFKVWATGNSVYGDSEKATSEEYVFSEQTLADVKKAAQAALQAMTVTNETTTAEILQVVQNVITNKKIQATWSKPSDFQKKRATDETEPGVNGSITGTIDLSYKSRNDTVATIKVDLSIAAKYKITFTSGHDDAQGDAPRLENAAAGTVITLPDNKFKVYGMNFEGWNDGTTTYASGASYTMPGKNVTFKAVWNLDKWDGVTATKPEWQDGYYLISTGAELAYFRDTPLSNWKAKLMCDIDLDNHNFMSINNAGAEFDGCGHTIRGLHAVSSGAYTGLFKKTSTTNCTIKNLTIEDAVIENTSTSSDCEAGILMGYAGDSITVENCYVSGEIVGKNTVRYAGGLIGDVHSSGNVSIRSCYANPQIIGITSNGFAGGLVGWTGGTTTIENSYAVVDMDVDRGYDIGGLVGCGSDSKVTISHSYAAGEALTKNSTGAAVAGISNNGSISSCVSIFPEMRSLNRIGGTSGKYTNNYGFAGTVARKSDGTILTPAADAIGAGKPYGADASAAELESKTFYEGLGWDFGSVWTMGTSNGYAFPVLKNQTLLPSLHLDLTPSVRSITLDKTSAKIYPKGSVQLTATVDAVNGASRAVTWTSSNPQKVAVKDGLVVASEDAEGIYTITAASVDAPAVCDNCEVTVDTKMHEVVVERNSGNSPDAEATAYGSLEDAVSETDPIKIQGDPKGTFTFSRKAGNEIYLAFKNLEQSDKVSTVLFTDENGTGVNAKLCHLNPTVYCFTMPCSDTSVKVAYAENMNAYQYTWFVGREWSTTGKDTVTYKTTEWRTNNIGSLKVTGIINGKKFKGFNIKSMSRYQQGVIKPHQVESSSALNADGDYCIKDDDETGLPILYIYLEGPGMVSVDIEVEDDENAEYTLTQKPGNKSYYTLNMDKAKAGKTITATLTPEGVDQMKKTPNQNAIFTYSGGLHILLFAPKFTESNGEWTASFEMPKTNIETDVIFGEKQKVVLSGDDREADYDGTPKSVNEWIRAEAGGTNISEVLQDEYEVQYEGVGETTYSKTTPPTNAGTYSCIVKIPESNVSYTAAPVTVRLTIKKSTPKTPKAPLAAARTEDSVTLEAPSVFADGTAIPAGYHLEYCAEQGEWQDSPVFDGLTPGTPYHFYVRIKADENTEASAASEAVTIRTKTAVASEASVSYDYKAETIQFAETAYEMNTDPAFGASTSLSAGGSITALIGKTVYIRVKATAEDLAGPVVAVTVPVRPQAPASAEAEQITSDSIALKNEGSAYEYRLGEQGSWQSAPYFGGLSADTEYRIYRRLAATDTAFASETSEVLVLRTLEAGKTDPVNPNPDNPQGTTTSGRDRSTSTWVKESAGWRYRLSNGTYLSGSSVLDPATGRQVEQVVWKQLRGAWWAFGADGYIRTGWIYDYSAGKWYYVDENTGMRTGWYLDPQDGRWYYLDPATGEMLTEWQLIPDLGYVYLNPYAPQPTWTYDEELKTWVYMEGAGRPYGSLYMAEWTPDGYYVNADGVWEPAR